MYLVDLCCSEVTHAASKLLTPQLQDRNGGSSWSSPVGSKLSIAALLVSPSGALRRALWAAHSRTSLDGDSGLTSDPCAVKAPLDFEEIPVLPSTGKR